MNGPPAKPISGVPSSSATSALTASVTKCTSAGLQGAQPLHVALAADRLLDHGADAGADVDADPGRAQRDDDVAEQDRRVHAYRRSGCSVSSVIRSGFGARLDHRSSRPWPPGTRAATGPPGA